MSQLDTTVQVQGLLPWPSGRTGGHNNGQGGGRVGGSGGRGGRRTSGERTPNPLQGIPDELVAGIKYGWQDESDSNSNQAFTILTEEQYVEMHLGNRRLDTYMKLENELKNGNTRIDFPKTPHSIDSC